MDKTELNEISQVMMLDFLQRHFPVQRLKDGRRFKRGIIVDGDFTTGGDKKIYLRPQNEVMALFANLSAILRDVFGFPTIEINMVLFKYLSLM